MPIAVSIVIPTWNGLELLKRFLPSVIAATRHYGQATAAPTEILIVDDGSTDATIAWLVGMGFYQCSQESGVRSQESGDREQEAGSRKQVIDDVGVESAQRGAESEAIALRFLRNERNCGFGESCNRGFKAASFRLVFLLNNDVEVASDAIAPLIENFAGDSVFAAHCRVFEFDSGTECGTGKVGSFGQGFIRVHRSYVPAPASKHPATHVDSSSPIERREPLYSMFASGGSAMFDREKFLQLGGFDRLLSPAYWEDVEISYRAWKRGYAVLYEPRSVVRHRVSSTMRKVNQRALVRMQQRNRLIYHWINLHDARLFTSHALWVVLLALTAPLRLRFSFVLSVIDALKRWPEIRQRRRDEKLAAMRSDHQVFALFASLATRPDVFVYDDQVELQRWNATMNER
jgi:GT2 family glycosyltransferase